MDTAVSETIISEINAKRPLVFPDAIFFDLDGTLIDSVSDLTVAIDKMLNSLHQDLPNLKNEFPLVKDIATVAGEEKVAGWIGNGAQKLVERALFDAVLIKETFEGVEVDDSSVEKTFSRLYSIARSLFDRFYAQSCTNATGLYSGAKELLNWLSEVEVPITLITNKPASFTDQILTSLELKPKFSVILGGDSLAKKKPDPMPLQYCLDTLQLAANNCWMVGDSKSDVAAAKAAGCISIGVSYGYNHGRPIDDETPCWRSDSLKQLHEQLLSLYSH